MSNGSTSGQIIGASAAVGTAGAVVTMLPTTSGGNTIFMVLGIITTTLAVAVIMTFIAVKAYKRLKK
jgi:hypothetical protein